MDDSIERIDALMRRKFASGSPDQIAAVNRTGGIAKFDRRRRWWSGNRPRFVAALEL